MGNNKKVLIDILSGVVSLVISVSFLTWLGLDVGSILLGVITLIVGLLRGKKDSLPLFTKSVLLILPFGIFLIGVINGVPHLLFLLLIAFTGTSVGIFLRRYFLKKRVIGVTLFLGYLAGIYLFGTLWISAFFNRSNWSSVSVPTARNFKLLEPNGDTLYSKELTNKILVLDFWATWCGPCKKQFPELEKLYYKYKSDSNVIFLAINSGRRKSESINDVKNFIKESKYHLPFAIDIDDNVKHKLIYNVLPTTIIIDNKGIKRYSHEGYMEVENFCEECSNRINFLLREMP